MGNNLALNALKINGGHGHKVPPGKVSMRHLRFDLGY